MQLQVELHWQVDSASACYWLCLSTPESPAASARRRARKVLDSTTTSSCTCLLEAAALRRLQSACHSGVGTRGRAGARHPPSSWHTLQEWHLGGPATLRQALHRVRRPPPHRRCWSSRGWTQQTAGLPPLKRHAGACAKTSWHGPQGYPPVAGEMRQSGGGHSGAPTTLGETPPCLPAAGAAARARAAASPETRPEMPTRT